MRCFSSSTDTPSGVGHNRVRDHELGGTMPKYTVVGTYADNRERFAQTVNADNPERAEKIAVVAAEILGHDLIVAAVLAGEVTPVDDQVMS